MTEESYRRVCSGLERSRLLPHRRVRGYANVVVLLVLQITVSSTMRNNDSS